MTVIERMARAIERENWSMSAAIVGGQRIDNREMNARRAKAALSILLEEMPEEVKEVGWRHIVDFDVEWHNANQTAEDIFHAMIQAIIEQGDQPSANGAGQ